MKFIKRFIYLGYYIKTLDWNLFRKFLTHAARENKKSETRILIDVINSVFKYNISLLEYFQFDFQNKPPQEKEKWAGTGFMYESINVLNPKEKREILSNKIKFIEKYHRFLIHKSYSIDALKSNSQNLDSMIKQNKKLLLKSSDGQCGRGIEVISTDDVNSKKLLDLLKKSGNDMVEEYVEQHDDLKKLSPSGLNTLRIITQINAQGSVDILGVRLRISNNSFVDNMAAGNIAAPVDVKTGIVSGKGVFSDITKEAVEFHPVTGVRIVDFRVPKYEEALALAKEAALFDTGNTSIGWDIAITNSGVGLIEGNHDWCKLVWQLPVKTGLKSVLEQYTD